MLKSAEICKKCTIFTNLRTVTQEGKKETRKWAHFFIYFLSSNCLWYSFLYLIIVKTRFHGVPHLVHSGLQNTWILELKLWDKNLSRSILETYTSRKVKNQSLLFLSSWELNLSDLMVYRAFVPKVKSR